MYKPALVILHMFLLIVAISGCSGHESAEVDMPRQETAAKTPDAKNLVYVRNKCYYSKEYSFLLGITDEDGLRKKLINVVGVESVIEVRRYHVEITYGPAFASEDIDKNVLEVLKQYFKNQNLVIVEKQG